MGSTDLARGAPTPVVDVDRFARGMEKQLGALAAAQADGMPRLGWKVGINVPEVQAKLGLPHAGLGWLDGRRVGHAGDTIAPPPGSRLHAEPELALEVGSPLHADATREQALASITRVCPALELVDYAKPAGDLETILGHSMFHHGVILGPWQPPGRASGLGDRLPTLAVSGRDAPPPRRGLVPELGWLLAFVARFLGAFGQALEPGDLVLSGSYCEKASPLVPGARLTADFGVLGRLELAVAA